MTMDPDPADSTTSDELVATPMAEMTPAAFPGTVAGGTDRRAGKTRNPWGVWGLSLVTLGIYQLYWYYKVNSEVREFDGSIEVEPGIAVLALFIPIANLVSMVKTGGRIARAQSTAGRAEHCSGGIGFLLIFLAGTWVVYYQSQLNKVWDEYGNPTEGTPVA
jgi:hypothetical protein